MIKRMGYVVAMMVVLGSSTVAMAQQTGGVRIGGDATVTGTVQGSNTTSATGENATATTDIGAIKAGTDIGGDATVTGFVGGDNVTVADGKGATATTSIGSIGTK